MAGRDVLGCAQTGTGKTAAFALPLIDRLSRGPQHPRGAERPIRALILTPTRELAAQIADSIKTYGKFTTLSHAVVFGGVNQNPQARALHHGVDIIIATPGRLLDLLNQGYGELDTVETFILDEADRMLDMGFIHDIRRIISKLPHNKPVAGNIYARQTLLFSATMPGDIRKLADSLLHDPVSVKVAPVAATADRIDQCVYFVDRRSKPALLQHLLQREFMTRVLVFTRTKHGADRVAKDLSRAGIASEAIHGNKRQSQRVRTLAEFKAGRIPVLVATDIAARGLDIDEVTHVINYEIPEVPETYVHRIGRTARAGASGHAIALCDGEERQLLRAIEHLTRVKIPVKTDHPEISTLPAPVYEPSSRDRSGPRPGPRNGPRSGPRPGPRSGPRSGPRPEHRTEHRTEHRAAPSERPHTPPHHPRAAHDDGAPAHHATRKPATPGHRGSASHGEHAPRSNAAHPHGSHPRSPAGPRTGSHSGPRTGSGDGPRPGPRSGPRPAPRSGGPKFGHNPRSGGPSRRPGRSDRSR